MAEEITLESLKAPEGRKLVLLGMAPSWTAAPFGDMSYDIWPLNNHWRLANQVPNFRATAWIEIHDRNSPSKAEKEHQDFLRQLTIPVFMWQHYDDIPYSVKFPKDEIMAWLQERGYIGSGYFTNSISWMLALAMYLGYKHVELFGIDLANTEEYGWQRPSCEYFVGLAEGMGVKLYIPPTSDLLKCTQLYGFESNNRNRLWIKAQVSELNKRKQTILQQLMQAQNAVTQLQTGLGQVDGAIGAYKEILKRTQ